MRSASFAEIVDWGQLLEVVEAGLLAGVGDQHRLLARDPRRGPRR